MQYIQGKFFNCRLCGANLHPLLASFDENHKKGGRPSEFCSEECRKTWWNNYGPYSHVRSTPVRKPNIKALVQAKLNSPEFTSAREEFKSKRETRLAYLREYQRKRNDTDGSSGTHP